MTEAVIAAVPDSLRWIGWQHIYQALARTSADPLVAEHCRRLLEDAYVRLQIRGRGIRLADIPDSEIIAKRIVEPLLAMFPDTTH